VTPEDEAHIAARYPTAADMVSTETETPEVARSAPQRIEDDKDLARLTKVLAGAKTPEAETKAMLAMRDAGASYSQIAQVLGVVPMTARSRVLKAQGAK
jgi:hypothetical protein